MDVTEIVRAQQAQKNFVQTLTKTFATLSIGLAIFDRNAINAFNPALIDQPPSRRFFNAPKFVNGVR